MHDEFDAAVADDPFEFLDGLEMGIDDGLIDVLPEMLGGLQLGAMRRLIREPDTVRHGQVLRAMPARAIDLKDDALVLACTRRFGEIGKDRLEHLFANGVGDVPHRASAGGFHKTPDVKPLITVMAQRNGPFARGGLANLDSAISGISA